MKTPHFIVASALMLGLTACGSAASAGETTEPPAPAGVVLTERGQEPCCYIEGFVRFVRIKHDGEVIFKGRWKPDSVFKRSLPAGTYRIIRELRPCEGNCGYLDPVSERCGITVTVKPGERLKLVALPKTLGTCKITR
jgi:hypothetical protein